MTQLAPGSIQFDLNVSSFAIHHVDVEQVLPRIAGQVRPGGWLFLREPACPIEGALRPLWYRWNALRGIAPMIKRAGIGPAIKMQQFQQSAAWIEHQIADRHWLPQRWQAVAQRLLPGAIVKTQRDHVTVLWQRTQPDWEAGPDHAAVAPTDGAPALIVAKRRYPLPAPDAFVPFPREAIEGSVVARFETQVERHGARIALRTPSLSLTYDQLNVAANRIAWQVLGQGESASTPVALLMDQDDPVIPALLGVLKAGCPYVVVDPADPVERQQRILDLTGARLLVTTAARLSASETAALGVARRLSFEEMNEAGATDNPGLAVTADQLAAIFFTSGSTGEPKGVARDQRQFLHSTWLNTNTYFIAPTDRQSLLYFPGFTASVPNIYDTLLNGATLYSLNPRNLPASSLLEWLRMERITHLNPPIGLWRGLLEAMTPGAAWPDLRLVTLAGQPLYGRDIRAFQASFGAGTALSFVLAMTEAGAVTQAYFDHETIVAAGGTVPVGYPLADKTVDILAADGCPAEPGEVGLVAITSAYLSLGYWQDTALTKRHFHAAPGESRRRTFLSSDRGLLRPDGCLEFYGRADSVVKVRGYRVDLTAIEAALNSIPAVQQCPHRSWCLLHCPCWPTARLIGLRCRSWAARDPV